MNRQTTSIRLNEQERKAIEAAALIKGIRIGEYIRYAATEAANNLLESQKANAEN